MQSPWLPYVDAILWILRHIAKIVDYDILYTNNSLITLARFTDINYVGDVNICRSTIGYSFNLRSSIIS